MRAAIPSAVVRVGVRDRVVIQEYGIDFTTQPVNDRIVVNGDRISFTPGTSAIRDVTSYGLGFTLITGVEESYDIYSHDPRFIDRSTTPAFLPPDRLLGRAHTARRRRVRNMTDHFIATRVAAVVGSHIDYAASGAGGFLNRINFPDAVTADFAGMRTPGLPQVWTQVPTSAHGVSSGNVRIPILANDWPLNHAVDRDINGVRDGTQQGLANKLAAAIDGALNIFGIDATPRGKYVRLNRGSVINISSIIAKGEGPGGTITGLATLQRSRVRRQRSGRPVSHRRSVQHSRQRRRRTSRTSYVGHRPARTCWAFASPV